MSDLFRSVGESVRRIREICTEQDFQDAGYTDEGDKYLTVQCGTHKTQPRPASIGRREPFGFNQEPQYLAKIQMNVLDYQDLPENMPKEGFTLSENDQAFGREQGWKLVGARDLGNHQLELWFVG
jgi:hypothetical protein